MKRDLSTPFCKNFFVDYTWSNTALEMSGGDGEAAVSTDGTATIPNEVFNLIKSIVGAGVLSLPAGAFIFIIYYVISNQSNKNIKN